MAGSLLLSDLKRWLGEDGWQVDERWVVDQDRRQWCFVTAAKAHCYLRADGSSAVEAWSCLVEQARARRRPGP